MKKKEYKRMLTLESILGQVIGDEEIVEIERALAPIYKRIMKMESYKIPSHWVSN